MGIGKLPVSIICWEVLMPSVHSYKYSMEETARYASLADEVMSNCDMLVVNGHNCGLRVSNKALHVKQGSLLGVEREPIIYYKGVVPIRTIVLLGRSGIISLEALHWCKEQNISLVMLDGVGNVLYSLSPESESNAKLRRAQYQAIDTGMAGFIARELVRRKVQSQIDTLKSLFPEYTKMGRELKPVWKMLEDGLPDLKHMTEILDIQMLEARSAVHYWEAFKGLPLYWTPRDEDRVPPHWLTISERMGSMSVGPGAKSARNPFHAALNYLYGVAEHLLLCSIYTAGLDPSCGFLHADVVNRNSLVYDLIEPHRSEIDAKVLGFFNRTMLRAGDVTLLPQGQITLNKELCRYLIVSCLPDAKKLGTTVAWLVKTLAK
jgi:CRISPR-associated protein Cas1